MTSAESLLRRLRLPVALLLAGALAVAAACGGGGDGTPDPTPEDTATAAASLTPRPRKSTTPEPSTVGKAATIEKNAAAEADGVRVILHQVTDPWVEPDGADPPAPGYRYVEIAVTVENRSGDRVTTGFDDFVFVSGDGSQREGLKIDGITPFFDHQEMAADTVVQGFVIGEVRDRSTLARIEYDADPTTTVRATFEE